MLAMWSENLVNDWMVLFVWLLARFSTTCLLSAHPVTGSVAGFTQSCYLDSVNSSHPRIVYSGSYLSLIRKTQPKQHIIGNLWKELGDLGIHKQFRGKRGGCPKNTVGNPVIQPTGNPYPNETTNRDLSTSINLRSVVPSLLVSNARSLAPKIRELQCVATQNSAGIVCITDTWLSNDIPDDAVTLRGYNLFQKDCELCGGGITLYVSSSIRSKRLENQELREAITESLWVELRPSRLPRPISAMLIGAVYHPPQASAEDDNRLRDHIREVVDSCLLQHPDCLVCVAEDFNPTSKSISLHPFSSKVVALRKLCV